MSVFGLGDLAFMGAVGDRLWTPAQITTALWLDAADAGTVIINDGRVFQWLNKSNTANSPSQGTLSARPSYGTETLNGISVVSGDGNDQLLMNHPIGGTGNFTYAAVVKSIGESDGQITSGGGLDSSTGFYAFHYSFAPQSGTKWISAWGSASGASLSIQDIDANWHISVSRYSNPNHQMFVDGVAGTLASKTDSSLVGASQGYGVFSGGTQVAGYFMQGSIAELLVLPIGIDNVGLQKLEGYLAHKWALTANLPSDHPFKSAAPTA